MKRTQIYKLACVVSAVLLAGYLGVLPFTMTENTVTVTPRSPTIQINGIQYHYEPFPLTIQEATEALKNSRDMICEKPKVSRTQQLVGKFSATGVAHKVVLNYEFLDKAVVMRDSRSSEWCISETEWKFRQLPLNQRAVRVLDGYVDAQYIKLSGKTGYYGSVHPDGAKWTPVNIAGGKYHSYYASSSTSAFYKFFNADGPDTKLECWKKDGNWKPGDIECRTTEGRSAILARGTQWADPPSEYIWVTMDDILIKIQVSVTGVEGGRSTPCSGLGIIGWSKYTCYQYTGFVMKAWIYVPSAYFETSYCGDGRCDLTEHCSTCEQDCGVCIVPDCGNGICDPDENFQLCPRDCEPIAPFCGDGWCNGDETCLSCTQDCGECHIQHCGDGVCSGTERCTTCPQDCGACPAQCGDGKCENEETQHSCPLDCGSPDTTCGNGVCDPGEDCRCDDCKCDPNSEVCSPEHSLANFKGCVDIDPQDTPPPDSEPITEDEEPGVDSPTDPESEDQTWNLTGDEPKDDMTIYLLVGSVLLFGYLGFIKKK
jgi:hypothetical protein